jgi:hypothetical protein
MDTIPINQLIASLGAEINEVEPENVLTEDDLIRWLATRIGDLLQYRTEYLFNILYCLDVDEQKMHNALLPNAPDPADIGLAKILIERQRLRLFTKQFYKQPKLSDEESGW